jgi:hypothetical protein
MGIMLKLNLAIVKEVANREGEIDIFPECLSDHRTLPSRQRSQFSLRGSGGRGKIPATLIPFQQTMDGST